jgi:NAD(P)-dependent dehydrogenase (short-subunit alcohol dehydrogenase family)
MVAELGRLGIEAAAFSGDVLDRASIASALAAVKKRFGQIDASGNASPPISTGEFPILSSTAAGLWAPGVVRAWRLGAVRLP